MRDVARRLRFESTPTEAILWQQLRRRPLKYKFRRQAPIGPFVVDFLCAAARLVVEVDGPIHLSQQQADQEREALLETLGLRFVRVSSEDVTNRLPEVMAKIRTVLGNSSI